MPHKELPSMYDEPKASSFVSREVSNMVPDWRELVESLDWNRIVLQAIGEHMKNHPHKPMDVCGECIKSILLRLE